MINQAFVKKLLESLDKALTQKEEKRDIIIFGSSALLALGIAPRNRVTMDIDMVDPEIDPTLQLIAAEIAEQWGLDITWLNSAGFIFSRKFPENWKDRIQLVFTGKSLNVSSLGLGDLIATKFYALCARGLKTDYDDLVALKPSQEDLIFAKKWILSRAQKKDEELENEIQKWMFKILEEAT